MERSSEEEKREERRAEKEGRVAEKRRELLTQAALEIVRWLLLISCQSALEGAREVLLQSLTSHHLRCEIARNFHC